MVTTDAFHDRWYIRGLAAVLLLLCGVSTLRYLWIDLFRADTSVPWTTQALCFALTAGSAAYFVSPRWGHRCLLGVAVAVFLVASPQGPPAAVVFWLGVLLLLAMPYVGFIARRGVV